MIVVIRYKTKAAACWALTFIVRIFVNDTIAIAVWTSFDTITIALWISLHLRVPSHYAAGVFQPFLVERHECVTNTA